MKRRDRARGDAELERELRGLDRLATCGHAGLAQLARAGTMVHIPAGWPLIQQRTPSDVCYLILTGSAVVARDGAVVASLGTGDVFGESGLLNGRLRSATVVAGTKLRLLRLDGAGLMTIVTSHPELGDVLLAGHRARTSA